MRLYRISTCDHIEDLTGTGSFLHGGRWNNKGTRLLYTAESRALSMLEALAHITMLNLKRGYCRVVLEWVSEDRGRLVGQGPGGVGTTPVGEGLETQENNSREKAFSFADLIKEVEVGQLPADWRSNPGPDFLREIGDEFVKDGKYLALKIPSVLDTESYNYLLNPLHPAFSNILRISTETVSFDYRLIKKLKSGN